MNQALFDVLGRCEPAEIREQLGASVQDLDVRVLQLIANLNGQDDSPEGQAVFSYVKARCRECSLEAQQTAQPLVFPPELVELREWVRKRYVPESAPITPELLEWGRRTFNKEEFLAGLREIELTGGLELKDFIHELE